MAEHLDENIICVLAHTRKATKGNPFHNKNNHPLSSGQGVVIHNGMLSNDDELFRDLKLPRGAETDSDIIRAILDANLGIDKDAIKELDRIKGSVASAMCHPADPTKLLLLRSGNPLVCADDGEKFYFASDKRAIYRAARPWIERHGFPMQLQAPNIAFLSMPNDTGWIIGSQGLEWHDKFSASQFRNRYSNYSEVYSPHGRMAKREHLQRQAEVIQPVVGSKVISGENSDMVSYVKCPNIVCDWMMALGEDQKREALHNLRCPHCKTNLNGATRSVRLISKQLEPNRPVVN